MNDDETPPDEIATAETDGCLAHADLDDLGEFTFLLEAVDETELRAVVVEGNEFVLRRHVRPGSQLRLRWENARGSRLSVAPVIGWEHEPALRLRPLLGTRGVVRREVRVSAVGDVVLAVAGDDGLVEHRGALRDLSIRSFGATFGAPVPDGEHVCVLHLSGDEPIGCLVRHAGDGTHDWFEFTRISRRDRSMVATHVLRRQRSEAVA